ncbi:MAG: hypothetical protein IT304_13225 [Dehalococcoidia bacterium]|nr:hypothetical protein [Dehalococcoidia bacterium]
MSVRRLRICTTVSLVLAAAGVQADDNPFQMIEYGDGMAVAVDAVDMQGNKVTIKDETGFSYGGDNLGKYAGGKIATGAKDPAVCGTFAGGTCSVGHLSPEAKLKEAAMGAASEAAGKAMDKAMDMIKKP